MMPRSKTSPLTAAPVEEQAPQDWRAWRNVVRAMAKGVWTQQVITYRRSRLHSVVGSAFKVDQLDKVSPILLN